MTEIEVTQSNYGAPEGMKLGTGNLYSLSSSADKTIEHLYRGIVSQDRYVAHGLVSNDSAYLFLRRRNDRYLGGQWDIPGGTVEEGESPEVAAVRECFEETGLNAECGGLITHYTNADTEGRNLAFHTMTYRLILAESDSVAQVKISEEEHDDAKWLSLSEALDLPLVWHVRQTLDFVRPKGLGLKQSLLQ